MINQELIVEFLLFGIQLNIVSIVFMFVFLVIVITYSLMTDYEFFIFLEKTKTSTLRKKSNIHFIVRLIIPFYTTYIHFSMMISFIVNRFNGITFKETLMHTYEEELKKR